MRKIRERNFVVAWLPLMKTLATPLSTAFTAEPDFGVIVDLEEIRLNCGGRGEVFNTKLIDISKVPGRL